MTAADHHLGQTTSARAALAVTAAFAIVLGTLLGAALATILGVSGALVVGWSAMQFDAPGNRRVATGSVAFVGGSLAFAGGTLGAVRAGEPVAALGIAATAIVAIETAAGVTAAGDVRDTALESGGIATLVFVLAAVWYPLVFVDAPARAWSALVSVATANHLAALLSLQLGVVAAGALAARAVPLVDTWVPGEERTTDRSVELLSRFRVGDRGSAAPFAAAVIAQAILANWTPAVVFVARFLDRLSYLGDAVDVLLLSGLVHAALALVLGLLAGVLVAGFAKDVVVAWGGASPGDTVATAAGGIAATALALVVGLLAAVAPITAGAVSPPGVEPYVAFFGPVALLLALVIGSIALAAAVATVAGAIDLRGSPAGSGFATAAALVFASAVAAADDVSAIVVLLGVGAALWTWDLGTQAAALGADLGSAPSSRRTELVHATTAGLALTAGVLVAAAVAYLLVPFPVAIDDTRATLALTLALIGLVSVAVAFRW